MISKTRFAKHFEIAGDKNTHYGIFPCETPVANTLDKSSNGCNC
jgi:hypothetical protein